MQVAAMKGESLDALVWRATGAGSPVVEAVLEANRGVAPLAQALPEHTLIIIPEPVSVQTETELVQLWD